MANKYSKLGYGNAGDVASAIESGKIDGKDLVVTKDTSELYYIKDDKSVQKIQTRTQLFNSPGEAIAALNKSSDTYAGQTVMIRDENGKYQPYTVQASGDSSFVVEPTVTANVGFVWQEF
nr:MAG TPA: hypothetical protein [Caudoviricetes sp.]